MADLTRDECKGLIMRLIREKKLPAELMEAESCTKTTCKSYLERLCEGALRGRDVEGFGSAEEWATNLVFSSTLLTREDYLRAAVHALRLSPKIAATDYGTSRQRDLAQVWTDAIRGFLGEIAFVKWLKERFSLDAELDFRTGPLEEFLPSDIARIKKPREEWREPKLKVSIKTTKLQGMWLDIPYAQIAHSDIFVLVRVGVSRSHFVAFLKEISVIGDKILRMAEELGIELDKKEVWSSIPDFKNIPAFVTGFFDKSGQPEIMKDRGAVIVADGTLRRSRGGVYRLSLNRFAGWWNPKDPECKRRLVELLRGKRLDIPEDPDKIDIEFEGLGQPSETLHFLISSSALKRRREDWENVISRL